MNTSSQPVGKLGATVQSFRAGPRDLMVRVIEENRNVDYPILLRVFTQEIMEEINSDDLRVVVDYWLWNNYNRYLEGLKNASNSAAGHKNDPRKNVRASSAAAAEGMKSDIAKSVAQALNIVLLDQIQANGKPLRECTGAYAKKLGGFYERVAKEVGPHRIIGKVLDENQLRKILFAR